MVFAHLKLNKTLRDIAIGFGNALSCFYHLGLKSMKRSTISDALKNRPVQVYEDFYYQILLLLNRSERRKLGMKINLIDSTTISMCIEKFNWAKYRKTKGGIKRHVLIDSETKLAEQVTITNSVIHDMNAIRGVMEFKRGEFCVYNRGYACYNYLHEIASAKAFFVTRLKSNWKIRVIKNKKIAKKIADIYKMRWQTELFFKWMKQHLKIKSFTSTSSNGVKIRIWIALITYVLLHSVKTRLLYDMDIFDIYRRIQDYLFNRTDLYDLLTCQIPKKKEPDNYANRSYYMLKDRTAVINRIIRIYNKDRLYLIKPNQLRYL